jgi:amino acid transporter
MDQHTQADGPALKRCLGPVEVTAQAVATVGLTLTAVINIPEAARTAGHATWISYAIALLAILLVAETLVIFRRQPGSASGIAGYVEAGLGPGPWPPGRCCWSMAAPCSPAWCSSAPTSTT